MSLGLGFEYGICSVQDALCDRLTRSGMGNPPSKQSMPYYANSKRPPQQKDRKRKTWALYPKQAAPNKLDSFAFHAPTYNMATTSGLKKDNQHSSTHPTPPPNKNLVAVENTFLYPKSQSLRIQPNSSPENGNPGVTCEPQVDISRFIATSSSPPPAPGPRARLRT